MKTVFLFPALLTVCSVVSAYISRSPFSYVNLFLSIVLFCMILFLREKIDVGRITLSIVWLLLLELAALVLLLFGVNLYQPSLAWLFYAVFVVMEICVTPLIHLEQ